MADDERGPAPRPEASRDWWLIAFIAGIVVLGWPLIWERQVLQGLGLVLLAGRATMLGFRAGRLWTLQATERDRGTNPTDGRPH